MIPQLFDATYRVRWRAFKRWTLSFFALPWAGALVGVSGAERLPSWALWATSLTLGLTSLFSRKGELKLALLWTAVLCAYVAAVCGGVASYAEWEASVVRGERGVLRGEVRSVEPYDPERLALRLRPEGAGSGRSPWSVRFVIPVAEASAPAFESGAPAAWPVRLYPFQPAGNPGEFDRRRRAMSRAYLATAYLETERRGFEEAGSIEPEEACEAARSLHQRIVVPGIGKWLQSTAWRWRCRLISAGAHRTGIALGLLLGQTDLVAAEAREAFSSSGMAHLLAVSGLHVSFVTAAVAAASKRGIGRHLPWGWLGAVAGVVYCGVVGGPPSARRAAAMLVAATVGKAFGRRLDGRRLLLVGAGALLASDPFLSFDLGFQLSVAATASILWTAPLVAKVRLFEGAEQGGWRRLLRRAGQMGAISIVAQAGTLPLIARSFSTVSWIAPLTNLVALPLSGASLILLLIGSVVSDVAEPLGAPLVKGGVLLSDGLFRLAEATSPWGGLELSMGTPLFLVGWYSLLVGALLLWEGRLRPQLPVVLTSGKRLLLAGMAAIALNAFWPTAKGILGVAEVWVFDVGQGDAILVRSPWGRHLLVDGGGVPGAAATGGYDVGAMRVVPALMRLGVKRLEAVVSTHPHEDHVHGLAAVVSKRRIGRVFASHARSEGAAYRAFREAVEGKGLTIEHLQRGSVIRLEPGFVLLVLFGGDPKELSPGREAPGANNLSVSLRIESGGRRFLLLGDAERMLLDGLREWWELSSDGLLIPHHGGASSFSTAFLDEVDPEVAVISVGVNAFGHPAPALLAYLAGREISTYRTDRDGAVLLQFWPWGIRVHTVR